MARHSRQARVHAGADPDLATRRENVAMRWHIGDEIVDGNRKYAIGDVIEKICGNAYLLRDEIYGLRPCPPSHRPSTDQMAELIQEIATARGTSGLDALPRLKG
jgi:hypothetical protein